MTLRDYTSMKEYKYIIIGAGICGCATAYELSKYSKDILLVDKNSDVATGASGAAGAFLSPLLGKPNSFKDLVTKSLKYATEFYKESFKEFIENCGTLRIPKDEKDKEKFDSYKPYMDFEYKEQDGGCYFDIGSVVKSYDICKKMIEGIETQFSYEAKGIYFNDKKWIINNEICCENLILATGHENELLDENYLQIRAVWGRRIDITSTTNTSINYHKACSVSKSYVDENGLSYLSIGATHHREKTGVEKIEENHQNLLQKANDIVNLENVKIVKDYVGARSCSVDYFPMIGSIIDGKKTLQEFPYLIHGTHVEEKRFIRYNNIFIINGVGGRGFVLAPFLAKQLVKHILYGDKITKDLTTDRLFKRSVKKREFE